MSGNFRLPNLSLAHAYGDCGSPLSHCDFCNGSYCSHYWTPAGPAMDAETAVIFTDDSAEFTNLMSSSPSIDLTDSPLPPNLAATFATSPNFTLMSTLSEAGYSEIQFNLANNFWGCSFNFGNSTCGLQIRQGIAHMIDTAKFAAGQPSLSGQAVALDSPNPSDNVGGLPPVNPCNWDSLFPETFSNCSNPPAGGLAYHLGTAAGAGGFVWNQAPASADLNAAAQHFVTAGIATSFNPSTSVLTGISSTALSNVPNFFIRTDNTPRLDLADSLGEQAESRFGSHAYTMPIYEQNIQFGFQGGWIRDINNAGSGLPNYFTWLNAWNPTPALPGTIRQGFKQTTSSVSPFVANNQWDAYIVGNIYDSLAVINPTSGGQLIYWMALSVQQLSNSSITYTPP